MIDLNNCVTLFHRNQRNKSMDEKYQKYFYKVYYCNMPYSALRTAVLKQFYFYDQ